MKEIEQMAKTGKPNLRGLSEEDMASIMDELVISNSPIHETLGPKKANELESDVIIGEGRDVKFPLLLKNSFFLDYNHFSKVNRSVRIALAYGAGISETPINIGEGLIPEERKIAKKFQSDLIMRWSPMRMGVDIKTLSQGKALIIEMRTQQNLMSYTQDEVQDRLQGKGGLAGGETMGPRNHLDMVSSEDIKKHVELLRETTLYNLPVMIKMPSHTVHADLKTAIEGDPDAVIIDTSIDPFSTMASNSGNFGATLLGSIAPTKKVLLASNAKKRGIKLLVSGGFRNGADIIKILALGADGVGINESAAVAMGCDLCGDCFRGKCEKGIATKDSRLRANFNWKSAGKRLANYLNATKMEMQVLLTSMGVNNVKKLDPKHITALTYDAAAITGVRLVGYDRELPMWFH